MLKKILYSILSLFILIPVVIYFTNTTYIYKTLYYLQPGIDDLDIFEYRTVKSGIGEEWSISKSYNRAELTDTTRKTLENLQSVAFLVIKNDSIRYEEYWEGYSDSSFSNSFSIAKSIVSTLTGIAIAEGKIKSIDQPVADFLPEFKVGEKSKITIRHLLTMSSGLNYIESYSSYKPFNVTVDSYYGTNLRRIVNKLMVIEEPGTIYRYKSGDSQILGMVLFVATGKSLSEYASEKLWSKIGSVQDAKWSIDHAGGDEKAFCCFFSNSRDFARLGKLYLQNGKWNNEQVVPKDWVKQSIQPHGLKNIDGKVLNNYGFQWWVLKYRDMDVFYSRGLQGQYVIVIPEHQLIIVRLGHMNTKEQFNGHWVDIRTYIDGAMAICAE